MFDERFANLIEATLDARAKGKVKKDDWRTARALYETASPNHFSNS